MEHRGTSPSPNLLRDTEGKRHLNIGNPCIVSSCPRNHKLKPKLLIVDHDDEIRTQVKWALAGDYDIVQAEDRTNAVAAFRMVRPLVVLLGLGLPAHPSDPDEGLATLSEVLALERLTKIN
jgi:ActR/RegA family two-component response regulator